MPARCLLYYITDRSAFPGNESARRRQVLEKIGEAARSGVDYVQLREKDLTARELESLAREAMNRIVQARSEGRSAVTALFINSRVDVALAIGADGVHLRSDDIRPQEVRAVLGEGLVEAAVPGCLTVASAGRAVRLIAVSCHTPEEVAQAAANRASFVVFAPVFEKVARENKDAPDARPAGLARLKQACRARIPVLALGGVTLSNARSCLEAGAAGIAGIRLFQENDIAAVVRQLHG
jgi:thiamine-phosphate pyrophosphorylase